MRRGLASARPIPVGGIFWPAFQSPSAGPGWRLCGAADYAAEGPGVGDAEVVVDLAGGGGLVEGIEVDASDVVVQELSALLGGPVLADPCYGVFVAGAALDGAEQLGGVAGAGCELGHALHALGAGDGHDPSDNGDVDAREFAALAEVEEVGGREEELGADVVGAGIDLGLEVVHLLKAVGGGGVALGEAGDAQPKAARVGLGAGGLIVADELH